MKILVGRYNIIGTPYVCYNAYEVWSGHTISSHFDVQDWFTKWGLIISRELPSEIAKMPQCIQREIAVDCRYQSLYLEAYHYIEQAYPELPNKYYTNGTIEVVYSSSQEARMLCQLEPFTIIEV